MPSGPADVVFSQRTEAARRSSQQHQYLSDRESPAPPRRGSRQAEPTVLTQAHPTDRRPSRQADARHGFDEVVHDRRSSRQAEASYDDVRDRRSSRQAEPGACMPPSACFVGLLLCLICFSTSTQSLTCQHTQIHHTAARAPAWTMVRVLA